ncbi:hypothetical protein SAMN05660659_04573 [Pseudomonas sp. LAMO17WK12:I6]|uniref:hypothetical protein n=1 Tax=unclassified Pseudomonas TaxID=196821 RepID=UPI000BD95DB2|nr:MULTISPECIES: hypothetical protein [unclassified Pseudomonas]SNY42063.1 hypothetical protein SAMN05660659_04573 [Pseudomonas sp. LAMO17WK12:I6]SNY43955.1 hypothetical protein SAMN05660455_05024 [Pseudomonas sp. LAMO17WK12:I5]
MPRKNHLIVDSGCTQDNERWVLSACGLNEDSDAAWDGTHQSDFVSCKRCLAKMAKPRPAPEPFHKERPILFNGAMVRAILSGQKTVTRRPIKGSQIPSRSKSDSTEHQWIAVVQDHPRWGFAAFGATEEKCAAELAMYGGCPYGQKGDRLWVRETFMDLLGTGVEHRPDPNGPLQRYAYRADYPPGSHSDEARKDFGLKWKPSIHMPRAACRFLLEITDVRVERLQDISRADIRAEGLQCPPELASDDVSPNYRDWYPAAWRQLWESTGGDWAANPWVWVVEFKRVQP